MQLQKQAKAAKAEMAWQRGGGEAKHEAQGQRMAGQSWKRLGKERGRQLLKWLESVRRAFTEQAKGRKGSLSSYF